ncbi:MAG TPA: hypothetical protein PKV16_08945 [Caldisericia bacterium]|nr:hypothetical protein [Caldisericia bacterium]HPF49791.1 hypothetical protein [Caldisericia bacterium]HPI84648.1 hypothetical protein [Caldisericia bacterium]HPQ93890.1 hypothetical protein [Caldisericia bacterium]HRV75687.1 hypothetical protein [Caldisericia bacterium]
MKNIQSWIIEETMKLGCDFYALTSQQRKEIITRIVIGLENGFRSVCNYPDLRFARKRGIDKNRINKDIFNFCSDILRNNKSISRITTDDQVFYSGSECINLCEIDNSGSCGQTIDTHCVDMPACTDSHCGNTKDCADKSDPMTATGCIDNECSISDSATCFDQQGFCQDIQCENSGTQSSGLCINEVHCLDDGCVDYRCVNIAPENDKCSTDLNNCRDVNCLEVGERQAPFDADRQSCPHMQDHSAESCIDHVCDPPDDDYR